MPVHRSGLEEFMDRDPIRGRCGQERKLAGCIEACSGHVEGVDLKHSSLCVCHAKLFADWWWDQNQAVQLGAGAAAVCLSSPAH